MTASTHMATGSAIALAINRPVVAIPLAFLSHFILDILPHFGFSRGGYAELLKHKISYYVFVWDIFSLGLVLYILSGSAWTIFAAGVAAVLPDLAWPYRYFRYERKQKTLPRMPVSEFHSNIQWAEKPGYIIFEITLFILMLLAILGLK